MNPPAVWESAVLRFHVETLVIYELGSRKFTTQTDLY